MHCNLSLAVGAKAIGSFFKFLFWPGEVLFITKPAANGKPSTDPRYV